MLKNTPLKLAASFEVVGHRWGATDTVWWPGVTWRLLDCHISFEVLGSEVRVHCVGLNVQGPGFKEPQESRSASDIS